MITVQLHRFEGPLALLLHLIRQQEMDIFDINIHEITRQYLESLKFLKNLDLEAAGDFVAMAATLLQIKSRMLLPDTPGEEGEQVEDPRQELVNRLVEYQKFQDLAKQLGERALLNREVYARGERLVFEPQDEEELLVEDRPLFSLIRAYRQALKNMKQTVHRVLGELQSIGGRIMEMRALLRVGQRISFHDLLKNPTDQIRSFRDQSLVTFISLLELAKMGFVSLYQSSVDSGGSPIWVETRRPIEKDVLSRVEEYNSASSVHQDDLWDHRFAQTSEQSQERVAAAESDSAEEGFEFGATDEDILAAELSLDTELGLNTELNLDTELNLKEQGS